MHNGFNDEFSYEDMMEPKMSAEQVEKFTSDISMFQTSFILILVSYLAFHMSVNRILNSKTCLYCICTID